jgi:hypothetical protein
VIGKDAVNDVYETDGYFWMPSEPDASGFGRLTADRDGIRLELIDVGWNVQDISRLGVLHGRAWDGPLLTIVHPFRGPWQFSGDWTRNRSIWWADEMITGAHINARDDVVAQYWSITMPDLKTWLQDGSRRYKPLLRLSADKRPGDSGEPMRIELDGGVLNLRLEVRGTVGSVEGQRELLSAQFQLDEPCGIDEVRRRYVAPLQDFLLFATRRPAEAMRVAANLPDHPFTLTVRSRHQYPLVDAGASGPSDLLRAGQFSWESFPDWLTSWYEFHATMADARVLWFETAASPMLPLGSMLLNLVAFAEGYHRQSDAFPQAPYTSDEHTELVASMLAALTDDKARKHYANPLRHANSRSQARRVRDLVDRAAKIEPKLKRKSHRLVSTAMDTRHWLTHWGERGEWVVEGRELGLVIEQLQFVLEANLVLDFFQDEDTAKAIVAQSYASGNLLELKPEPGGREDDW